MWGALSRIEQVFVDCYSPISVRDALRAVITNEHLWTEGEWGCLKFSLELLRAEDTVLLRLLRGKSENFTRRERAPVTGFWGRRRAHRAIREDLVDIGMGRRATGCIAACPDVRLGAVLRAHLAAKPVLQGIDPRFAAHLVAVYSDPDCSWDRGRWRLADQLASRARRLALCGGILIQHELRARCITATHLKYLRSVAPAPPGKPTVRLIRQG